VALSAALNQRLSEALQAVRGHPEHELTPPYRHLLYVALGARVWVDDLVEAHDLSGVLRRASLGIMTARHTIDRAGPGREAELAARSWLEWAEEVVRLTAERRITATEREALDTGSSKPAWRLAEMAYAADRTSAATVSLMAAAALRAAVSDQLALWEDGGLFHPAGTDENVADADLDVEDLDVAALAARAEAGEVTGKRLAFWEWWLTTALPAAWDTAPPWQFPVGGDELPVRTELAATIGWEEDAVAALQVSSDNGLLAYGVAGGPVRLWSLTDGRALATLKSSVTGGRFSVASPDQAVAFAPDGHALAAPHAKGGVSVWTRDGQSILTLVDPDQESGKESRPPRMICCSPDGTQIAAVAPDGRAIRVWELGGTILATLDVAGDTPALRALFSPEGTLLAALDAAGYVQLWNTLTWGALGRFSAVPDAGRGPHDGTWYRWLWCDFFPDGSRLVVRGPNAEGWVHVWAVDRAGFPGRVELSRVGSALPLRHGPCAQVGLSPDGTLLAITDAGDDDVPLVSRRPGILIVSAQTMERVDFLRCPDDRPVSSAFSPDGALLAMAGGWGGEVWIWDVRERRLVASFPAHADAWDVREGAPESPFKSLLWAPSGGFIVTSGLDPDTPNPNHVRPYVLGVHHTIKVWAVVRG
jgi:WD40 repeat protein